MEELQAIRKKTPKKKKALLQNESPPNQKMVESIDLTLKNLLKSSNKPQMDGVKLILSELNIEQKIKDSYKQDTLLKKIIESPDHYKGFSINKKGLSFVNNKLGE